MAGQALRTSAVRTHPGALGRRTRRSSPLTRWYLRLKARPHPARGQQKAAAQLGPWAQHSS